MTVSCPSCGDQVETTYRCRACTDEFCIECRRPADHDCDPSTATAGSTTAGGDLLTNFHGSMAPAGRLWRRLHWAIPVALSLLLAPLTFLASGSPGISAVAVTLSFLLFGVHVYADRLAPRPSRWTPGRNYYLPTAVYLALYLVPKVGGGVATVVGYVFLLPTLVLYSVRRYRSGTGEADPTDAEITDLLDEARTAAGTGEAAREEGDAEAARESLDRAIERAETARERARGAFPDRVPEIEEYLEDLESRRADLPAEDEA
ncbi:MAG: hypothetical protein ABEJ30_00965 [Halorientalis sp.]